MCPLIQYHAGGSFCFTPEYPLLPGVQLLASFDLFIVFIVLPVPECHIVGIIRYVAFPRLPSFAKKCVFKLLSPLSVTS